jgi:hypothetical protein
MKMETPKMDVVRFKEADVLAASPAPVDNNFYALTSGWGGATGGASLKIIQHDEVIENYDWDRISSGEAAHLINNNINFDGLSLGTLYADECTDNPQYDAYNGQWISSNGVDYRRHQ